MRLFSKLYTKVLKWAQHPKAERYLFALSFAESSFFPIPPDVMLAPMAMTKPAKAIYFATLTTLASVLGGIAGYLIGALFYQSIAFVLNEGGMWYEYYRQVNIWFTEWGVWAIFIAGFSPVPYKIFTISAGVLQMAILPFVLASLVGRGARFFLLALLMKWGGKKMEQKLLLWVDRIGWSLVVFLLGILLYHYGWQR